jgi:3-phenylpropionate/cinnamic acid dioxygenase small subunit
MAQSPDDQITARDAIAALIYRYAELMDLGDLQGVSELFEKATYRSDAGGLYRGTAAVREVLDRVVILYAGIPCTKHVTTNLLIEVDEREGTAQARSYYTVVQQTDHLPLQAIVAGRYQDRFARDGQEWHFTDRLIFIDLRGDLSQHLRTR